MAIQTKRILGLAHVYIGNISSDGGMSQNLIEVGDTVRDSVVISNAEGTKQEFFIEEADAAVESYTTAPGVITAAWSTTNTDPQNMVDQFGGTANDGTGVVETFGTITGGSGYANGTYTNVPLTGGAGSGARATIVVAGGVVTSITKTAGGYGYAAANNLSALAANIGGTGTGFVVPVATVVTGTPFWSAPDTMPDIEKSVRIVDSRGNIAEFTRVKLSSKMLLNFKRSALGQIDISGTVLVPNKAGESSFRLYKVPAS